VLGVLDAQGRKVAGVARMTNLSRTYLSLVFHGRRPATEKVKARVADALGMPVSDLFHDDTTPSNEAA
jgi:transcriptional regulator with XRE-family HTH domain